VHSPDGMDLLHYPQQRSLAEKEFSRPVNPSGEHPIALIVILACQTSKLSQRLQDTMERGIGWYTHSRPKGTRDRKKLFFPEAPHHVTGPNSSHLQKERVERAIVYLPLRTERHLFWIFLWSCVAIITETNITKKPPYVKTIWMTQPIT